MDKAVGEHHLQMHERPAAAVSVRHIEAGDDCGEVERASHQPSGAFAGDLADAVGRHESFHSRHSVAVAERVALMEFVMTIGLIHRRRRAVQEGFGLLAVLHQQPRAFGVIAQVVFKAIRLGNGEVQHIVGIARHIGELPASKVSYHAVDPCRLKLAL